MAYDKESLNAPGCYTRAHGIAFTSNQLKLIAIIAMLIDHCVIVFVPHIYAAYQILRIPGKLTAPIMCYLIAEGYYHTSNLRRYMIRLLVMAVISHFPFALCLGYDVFEFWEATDVLWSLLCGLIALTVYHQNISIIAKGCLIGLCCLLAYSAD